MEKNPLEKSVQFVTQNSLKLTCEHIKLKKFFRGQAPGPPSIGEGRGKGEGGERERRGGKGERGEGRGGEGRGKGREGKFGQWEKNLK
jgi:hypothetical protein